MVRYQEMVIVDSEMTEGPSELRARIVQAAAQLLTQGGREAVSTRGVSAAAGVQAPAIYRQFGDMRDLLHAAAREVLAGYVREKVRRPLAMDPVEELRRGWDLHVAFGLANPAAYQLLYATADRSDEPEVREGEAHLTALVARVAEAGRLRVTVPLAVKMIHAAGCGVTLSLIGTPPEARDQRLSSVMREAVLEATLAAEETPRVEGAERIAARAIGLRAVLKDAVVLSAGERLLLGEWLDRMAQGPRDGEGSREATTAREKRRVRK